ncbi:MAG: response regulator [Gammaproteobacteria bacterium]|nr:response regulator [Gammaproteobacteria bacterium]
MTSQEPKSALIVDDSRTARQVLARVLERHSIKVDMVASAEEALNFLAGSQPDVIFMDHLMPGMDGFQAVRAIKKNPATATIPIMMYTSQAGELYVSQARALGAVGVLPKQIKPVQVSDTLKSLNLLPVTEVAEEEVIAPPEAITGDVPEVIIADSDVEQTLADVERMMEPADWGELHTWFEEMLSHHQASLRNDIETSVARLLKESADDQQETIGQPQGLFGYKRTSRRGGTSATLLVAALALLAGTFFWLYLSSEEKWREAYQENIQLLSALESERAATEQQLAVRPDATQTAVSLRQVIRELEWMANSYAMYEPPDIPFGDARLKLIDGLVSDLRQAGFRGVIRMESYAGDFCELQTEDGNWVRVSDDLPLAVCDRVGVSAENALAQSATQSVAFANYLAALNGNLSDDIRIEVSNYGNTSPVFVYPPEASAVSAEEWNQIARQNNRVQVRLIPADTSVQSASNPF